MWNSIKCSLRATLVIAVDMVLAAFLCACLKGFEVFVHWLSPTSDPLLWDLLPVRYIFQTGEAATYLGFAYYGFWHAMDAFHSLPAAATLEENHWRGNRIALATMAVMIALIMLFSATWLGAHWLRVLVS
ncbi:MAG: hypothetical protein ACREDH_10435 [Methylocella sp.]